MPELLSRRNLIIALGAAFVAGVGTRVWSRLDAGDAAYAHTFVSVADMQAEGALIVDIRTPPEWRETGVIDGAVLATFDNPERFLAQISPALDEGRPVYLICRSGNRTQRAAGLLAQMIENPVVSVAGGMKEQIKQGYQTVAVE